jgi:hypothetical protein
LNNDNPVGEGEPLRHFPRGARAPGRN